MDQAAGSGYVKGIEAMRRVLVREFANLGGSQFTGEEIASLIQQAPGPLAETGGKVPTEAELASQVAS